MSRATRPASTDALMKNIAGKLQTYFDRAKQPGLENARDLWDVWKMFRVLTLRIRDLEQEKARTAKPDPELIKALAKLPAVKP
jgi:hypothetical protein